MTRRRYRRHPSSRSDVQTTIVPFHVACMASALLTVVAVTAAYVSSEHTFYSSDYAGYQLIAQQTVAQFDESLRSAMGAILRSTASEYNAYFTVPLIPWLLFDRDSRLVFELALAVTYLLPFVLMLGAVAVKVVHGPRHAVFWSTVALALATPMTWVPTLRGYPDVGAGLLTLAALWLYLSDMHLRRAWHVVLIGVFMAASFLFRRHFAHAVIAFLVALELQVLIAAGRASRPARRVPWRGLWDGSVRVALTSFVTIATLATVGFPLVMRGLTTDYNALYAAYLQPPLPALMWYAATYGWLVVLAAVTGYVLGLRSGTLARDAALFVVLFGVLEVLEWLFVSRQTGEQYTVHFTPFVVLGTSALLWTVWRRGGAYVRVLVGASVALLLIVNLIVGLTTIDVSDVFPLRAALAMNHAPLRRGDHAELVRLVGALREVSGHGEPIYVAASSSIVSTSLVASAERALFGSAHARLRLLYAPQIDSRDPLPLEMLVQARYVVTAAPFQHHLDPGKQRVVQAVCDLFLREAGLARDFVRLPTTFTLDEGTVVSIYRRTAATSLPMALATLGFMRTYLPRNPGGQPDWLTLSDGSRSSITKVSDGIYRATLASNEPGAPMAALYVGKLSSLLRVSGVLVPSESCGEIAIEVSGVDGETRTQPLATIVRRRGAAPEFAATVALANATAVVLSAATVDARSGCTVVLEQLRVEPSAT